MEQHEKSEIDQRGRPQVAVKVHLPRQHAAKLHLRQLSPAALLPQQENG